MAKIVIIGGGFNGQLLATLFKRHEVRILDWRDMAPPVATRSLGPQYLWKDLPGLPCESFPVTTLVDGAVPEAKAIYAYKQRVGKEADGGDWLSQFAHITTGWTVTLPPATVEYGMKILCIMPEERYLAIVGSVDRVRYDYLISTIPLVALLPLIPYATRLWSMTGQDGRGALRCQPIYVETTPLNWHQRLSPDLWWGGVRVNYLSGHDSAFYRETWRDGQRYRETLTPLKGLTKLTPGKIYPNPRTRDLVKVLRRNGVCPFGRFAEWEPEQLSHETYVAARAWASQEGL